MRRGTRRDGFFALLRMTGTGGESVDQEKERKQKRAQAKKRNKLVKGGKLGRPKKLTPEELRRGVEAYFASITYQEPVTREVIIAV